MLPFPPARTDPDERPPTRQRRQRRRGLGRDAGGPEGHRRHERPELEPRRRGGQGAERHPRLGDRVPGATDLRDLDEVVHERDAGEPGLLGGSRHVAQPCERGPASAGKRDSWSTTPRRPTGRRVPRLRRRPGSGSRRRRLGSARCHPDDLPPLFLEQVRGGGDRGELAGEDAGRDRAFASGVARTAYGRGRVEDDRDGRKPCSPGRGQPAAAAAHVGAERVDDSGQAAPDAGPRRPAREGRTRRPWRRDRAHRCRRPRAAGPRRRPRQSGSATTPRSTCPSPTRRPARRGPGRAGHGGGVSAPVSASGGGRGRRARPTPCARWAPR